MRLIFCAYYYMYNNCQQTRTHVRTFEPVIQTSFNANAQQHASRTRRRYRGVQHRRERREVGGGDAQLLDEDLAEAGVLVPLFVA